MTTRPRLPALLLLGALACSSAPSAPRSASAGDAAPSVDDEVRVAVTSFPLWLFARNLLAGIPHVRLDPVWPAGHGCAHDVVYTPAEQRRILSARFVVVNGLGLGDAAARLVAGESRGGRGPLVIDASKRADGELPAWILQRLPEAFAHRPLTRADRAARRPNPHYFTGPLEAAQTVEALARAFRALPGLGEARNRIVLEANRDRYAGELRELAETMRDAVAGFGNNRIATQHDAFAYLARDLGLRVVAILSADPDHGPTPAELRVLFERIVERGAGAVILEPGADPGLILNARDATKLPVGVLDPVANGPLTAPSDHYQKTMRANLEELARLLLFAPAPDPKAAPDPNDEPPPARTPRNRVQADAPDAAAPLDGPTP